MASLFYARLLESPGDMGEHVVLRDAYCFGTPRACGAKLASRFEYNLRRPENLGRALWRVSNRSASTWIGDVVTRTSFFRLSFFRPDPRRAHRTSCYFLGV